MRKGLNESVERSQDEVCGVYHGGGIRGRRHERCGFAGQPQAANHPGRGAWLRGHVAGGASLRTPRSGQRSEPTWASPPWGGGGNQAAVAQPLAAPKSARCGADTPKSGILACENGPRAAHSHDASIPIHCLSDRRPLRSDSDRSDLARAAALQDGRFAGRAWQRQGQDDRQPRNRGENRREDT